MTGTTKTKPTAATTTISPCSKLGRMPAPLPDRSRAESISTLQALLPLHLGLYLAAKQAHWAVRGSLFLQLHKLFDKVAKTAANGADTIAERIRQLGGETTPVTTDPLIPGTDGLELARQLSQALANICAANQSAIAMLISSAHDEVSANLLTDVEGKLEKMLWMLESVVAPATAGAS